MPLDQIGPVFAAEIRRKRARKMWVFTHWRWHLDEVYVKIIRRDALPFWRAVDHEGEVLESFASKTRDKPGALKFSSLHAAATTTSTRIATSSAERCTKANAEPLWLSGGRSPPEVRAS